MIVEHGKKVTMNFKMMVDGVELENTYEKKPKIFSHGDGTVLEKLERDMIGMSVGDSRKIVIDPHEGHGPHDPNKVKEVPKHVLPNGQDPKVGATLELKEKESGRKYSVTVTKLTDKTMTLDFNHPYAGKALEFYVEVLKVT